MSRDKSRTRATISRRYVLVFIHAFLLVASTRADNWLQYNGNAGNRTSNETIGTIPWSKAAPPTPYWKIPTPNGFSSFSVADGKAFTLISRVHTDAVKREFCVAFDTASGAELWAAPMVRADPYDSGGDTAGGGDGPRSTPTCDGERVYVLDRNLNLYCFNDENGAVVWKKNIVADYGGRNISWQNAASPLLEGELVVMAGGGSGRSFLAFNRTDGALVWKTDVNEKMTHASPVAATIHGVRQIIFYTQSGLVAVSADKGEELWRYYIAYSTSAGASPVVSGSYIYHSAGYGVGAGVCRIDKIDQNFEAVEVWRKQGELENHWSTPVCYNGYLYGLYGYGMYESAPLKCVELATGTEMWSKPNFGQGNLMLVGNKLVVLGVAGDIAVVEATPTAYTEIARADVLEGKCWSSPILSDNRLYARSSEEGICFALSSVASGPMAPGNPRATTLTLDSMTCEWEDKSDNETGFVVYFGAGPQAPDDETSRTEANATRWTATGLSVNTQYAFQVSATGGTSESAKTENYTTWTLAATPKAPTVGSPTVSTLDVAVGEGDLNPATTVYAIRFADGNQWVQADGTLGSSAVWKDAASWATVTVTGLPSDTDCGFQVLARNGAGVKTALGPVALGRTKPAPPIKPGVMIIY